MSAELTVLGAGSILPRRPSADGRRFGPAGYALRAEPRNGARGEVTLFDCGPGSVRALGAAGITIAEVRRVVLSHFHPDHCLDLFALLFARRNPYEERAGALELVAPVGVRRLIDGGRKAFGRWVAPRSDEDLVVHEVEPPEQPTAVPDVGGDWSLSCVATGHTPHALAWRAESRAGESFVFSGDTGEREAVAALAREVDLFLCECSFADERGTEHHLTPSGAARLARAAGARKLVLTHFYPGLEPEEAAIVAARSFHGAIETAADGSVHSLR